MKDEDVGSTKIQHDSRLVFIDRSIIKRFSLSYLISTEAKSDKNKYIYEI